MHLSVSVGFLTGRGNFVAPVLFCALPCPAVVWSLRLIGVCHTCTGAFEAPVAVIVAMLGYTTGGVICVGRGVSARMIQVAGGVVMCLGLGGCITLSCSCCLKVCIFVAAATTTGSDISGMGVDFVKGIHVGVALGATMLRTFMSRCAT